jgi:hypothetical protein
MDAKLAVNERVRLQFATDERDEMKHGNSATGNPVAVQRAIVVPERLRWWRRGCAGFDWDLESYRSYP